MRKRALLLCVLAGGLGACEAEPAPPPPEPVVVERLPVGLFLQREPPGAVDLRIVCEQAAQGDMVLVAARVAPGADAFATDRAEMRVVSSALADGAEPAPNELATLRVTGPRGQVMRSPLAGEQGLASGARVVVEGVLATKDAAAGHVVDAIRIFVEPAK